MRFFSLFMTAAAAAFCLSACAASQGQNNLIPVDAALGSAATPFGAAATIRGGLDRQAWMDPQAKHQDLLYVSDVNANAIVVYTYKQGQRVGRITAGLDQPAGECVDKHGDVFVANTKLSNIVEYARGETTPKRKLPDTGYYPTGCAFDPSTGNVAVANYSTATSGQGDVAIFLGANGEIQHFSNSAVYYYWFCSYDKHGDLFVDGLTAASKFVLEELPKGSTSFRNITLDQSIGAPGGVQWVGKTTLTVGDESDGKVYRFALDGTKATLKGATTLGESAGIYQYTISGRTIVGPNASLQGPGSVRFWKYPAGGDPTETLPGLEFPVGTAISKAG